MGRRARDRVDDYERGEDGSYTYVGKTWRWESDAARSAFLRSSSVLCGAGLACLVGAGFLPASATTDAFLATLPYAVSLVLAALAAASLARLARAGGELRSREHDEATRRLPFRLAGATGCAALAAAGSLVRLALVGPAVPGLAFFVLTVAATIALGQALVRVRGLTLRES